MDDVRAVLTGWETSRDGAATACIAGLAKTPNIWRLPGTEELRWIAQRMCSSEGRFVVDVLRVWMPWIDLAPEHGLAVTYMHLAEDRRSGFQPIDSSVTADELAALFESDPRNWYRMAVQNVVTDSMVALVEWVAAWNRKITRYMEFASQRERVALLNTETDTNNGKVVESSSTQLETRAVVAGHEVAVVT